MCYDRCDKIYYYLLLSTIGQTLCTVDKGKQTFTILINDIVSQKFLLTITIYSFIMVDFRTFCLISITTEKLDFMVKNLKITRLHIHLCRVVEMYKSI